MYKETCDGVIISIKVIPKANVSEIVGSENNELKIKIKAVPDKGLANAELIGFLSKKLKIAKSCFTLISGDTSRHKRVLVKGMTLEQIQALFKITE